LEYAIGLGDKGYGSALFLANSDSTGLNDHKNELCGKWRYKQIIETATNAAMPNEILHTNYCTGGSKNLGYLNHDGTQIGHAKKKFRGKLAKRMEFMSGTQREGLRFAYLSETFTRVSGRNEFQHMSLALKKTKMFDLHTRIMDGNLTMVKQKNRGRRPHRKDEEDNWLFLARCSLSVVDSPPIEALSELKKRVQIYDSASLSDPTWITTAKLFASFASRMNGFWQTTEDMLLSRTDGGLMHQHVTNRLESKTWNIKSNLIMRRGKEEDEEDTDDNWIPETYLLEDVFCKYFHMEPDDQSLMEDEMQAVRATFSTHGALIRRIFAHYSVGEEEVKKDNKSSKASKSSKSPKSPKSPKSTDETKPKPSMDRGELNTFIADIKIIKTHKKQIKNKQIVNAFNKANLDIKADIRKSAIEASIDNGDEIVLNSEDEEDEGNLDDELNTSEFVSVLLRLAVLTYGKRYDELSLGELLEKFISNDIKPNAMAADKNIMETALKDPTTQAIFKKNRRMLKKIFDKYAAADASDDAVQQNTTINLEELKSMCRDASLFSSISDRMLRQIFMAAQQDADDEEEGDSGNSGGSSPKSKVEESDDSEMDVSEFQEFLLAFGLLLEPDPHMHYAKKTENFIEILVKRLRGTLHKR